MRSAAVNPISVRRTVILTAGMPAAICVTLLSPVANKLAQSLGHGADAAMMTRLVLTIVGLAMLVGAPAGGLVLDRVGPARLLRGSILAWMLLGIAGYGARNLEILIVLRFMQGVLAGAIVTTGITILGELPDESTRASAAGFQTVVSAVTSFSVMGFSGVLGDINWRYVFLLHLCGLPVLVAALLLPDVRPARTVSFDRPREGLRAGLRSLPWEFGALALAGSAVSTAALTYMPFRFHAMGIESTARIGMALTVEAIMTAFVAALFGVVRRKLLSDRGALLFSFLLAGIGGVIAALAAGFVPVFAGLMLLGVGVAWMTPNLLAMLTEHMSPANRGRQVGFVKGFHLSGGFVAALLLEPVVREHGPSSAMMALALLSIVVALAALLMPRHIWFSPAADTSARIRTDAT